MVQNLQYIDGGYQLNAFAVHRCTKVDEEDETIYAVRVRNIFLMPQKICNQICRAHICLISSRLYLHALHTRAARFHIHIKIESSARFTLISIWKKGRSCNLAQQFYFTCYRKAAIFFICVVYILYICIFWWVNTFFVWNIKFYFPYMIYNNTLFKLHIVLID